MYDLDEEGKTKYRCSNTQDCSYPIASVGASNEFGLAVVVDVESNMRIYDIIRYRKIGKICARKREDTEGRKRTWRLFPIPGFEIIPEQMIAVTQNDELPYTSPQELAEGEIEPAYSSETYSVEKMKNFSKLSQEERMRRIPEVPFYLQKSEVFIFRFEDVVLNLYPAVAAVKRKGLTTKEVFLRDDPERMNAQGGKDEAP
jgi:hypothetical protein